MRPRRSILPLLLALGCSAVPLAAQTGVWSSTPTTQQVDPRRMENPDVVPNSGPVEGLVAGTWDLWVPGGVWYSSDGRTIYRNYTPGAAMNRLIVRADGGYQWAGRTGRLVEVRPWFAQAGERYYAVEQNPSMKYMARYDAREDKLSLFAWGVGGHLATGSRVGAKPAAPSAPVAATPAVGTAMRLTGTAVNSGVTGAAELALQMEPGGSVRGSVAFSGGLGGSATLQGTRSADHLNLHGELVHGGVRYTLVIDGRLTSDGDLSATYSLTTRDRAGTKQGGTLQARASGGAAARPVDALLAPPAPPTGARAPASAPAAPADNPLGVVWVGGDTRSVPAAPNAPVADPACAPNTLGVVWAQCKASPSAPVPTASASPLVRTWRYTALQVRLANGEVQDHSARVQGSFTLREDGTFVQDLQIGGQPARRSGRYRIEGEQIHLQGSGGQTATLWFRLEERTLLLQESQADGAAVRYTLSYP